MDWNQSQDACICTVCPSYYSCGEDLAFCMPQAQISKCITVENGCLCPACPVREEMHFNHDFYCTRGNEIIISKP